MNLKRKILKREINWNQIRKILLIRLRSMGDIVLMTPVISSLKQWKPDLNINVLIEARFKALLEGNPLINSIILDKTAPAGKSRFADLKLFIRELSRQKFDMVMNLHGGTRSTLQTLTSCAIYRAAPEYFRYGFIYNIRTPLPEIAWQAQAELHTVQNQLSILKGLNIPIADCELTLPCKEKVQKTVEKELASLGIKAGKPYILIHPGGSFPSKRWEPGKFALLSDWLLKTYKLPVLIIADFQEKEIVNEMLSKTTHTPFSWVAPSLAKLIALIKNCSLYIGNDAGPTHIAAAFKKPIVVIFGSSNPKRWHPWKTSYSLIRYELSCSPCPGKKCNHANQFNCIKSVTIEDVKNGVKEQISKIRY